MAAGKKRKQGNDIYMYDNLVRVRQTQAEQNTDGYDCLLYTSDAADD